ncbi:MAG TPA: acyltransferase [Hanamia sp.]
MIEKKQILKTSRGNASIGYIPQLDGIRGLAIILVVTFHYWGNIPLFTFGWSGVDLFFVLSGYLITDRLIVLQQQKDFLKRFYINRALRIMPVYYLTLILFYAAFNLFVKKQNFHLFIFYDQNWASFVLFLQNWSFQFYHGVKENYLQHFWSLAIEEQFYLLWPFFLYQFRQKKYFYKLVLSVIIIVCARTLLFITHPSWEDYGYYFYNTFCRMDAFLIGGCLLLLQQGNYNIPYRNLSIAALAIIFAGIFYVGNAIGYANPFISTIGLTLIAVMYGGLIYAASNNTSKFISTIFNYGWLKFTGKISYGLYIFHWLILRLLSARIEHWLIDDLHVKNELSRELSLFICLGISYAISVLSYFYFELYFLKKKLR